jgi:hypothetical protein
MNWKYVFNSEVSDQKWWENRDRVNDFAKEGGYSFFTWNGYVYNVDGKRTDILTEDLV